MDPQTEALRQRSKTFAVRIVRLFRALPPKPEAFVIGKQLLRSGTSVAANYRAVCRARSRAEFVSRIGVVVEEIDESVFWLELLVETGLVRQEKISGLMDEAEQLLRIFSASRKTAKESNRVSTRHSPNHQLVNFPKNHLH
jgi:four helix bundle protein